MSRILFESVVLYSSEECCLVFFMHCDESWLMALQPVLVKMYRRVLQLRICSEQRGIFGGDSLCSMCLVVLYSSEECCLDFSCSCSCRCSLCACQNVYDGASIAHLLGIVFLFFSFHFRMLKVSIKITAGVEQLIHEDSNSGSLL
ncbi:hypothetical protein Dimus_038116 [Dionaea muscipula]